MSPFKLILAATDFSVPANNAVRRAALLAVRHDARLRIVHVVNPARSIRLHEWLSPPVAVDLKQADARASLHRLAEELAQRFDVTAQLEMRSGDTVAELHRASARADLLVMGQRRRNPLAEMVLGRTAQRLVECCRRPVLVVKQTADSDYRRALVPIDFTPASDAAAFVAAALSPEIDLQVFHAFDSKVQAVLREAGVCESVIRESHAKEEAVLMARMRRSMTRLGLDSRKMSFALGRGSPVKATLAQAQHLDADVLVATKQRRGRIATSVLGHVNGLLMRSRCDMLIVSGWVRDPRRPPVVAQRGVAARAASSGALRGAQASATGTPSWTRPSLPAAPWHAGQRSRAVGG